MEDYTLSIVVAIYTLVVLWLCFRDLKEDKKDVSASSESSSAAFRVAIEAKYSSATKEDEIKALYEHLRTRALDVEGVNDLNKNQAFPLWININEVYHILSMHYNEELMDFLNKNGLCYDHGFGCDADDHELPEFPAAKSSRYD